VKADLDLKIKAAKALGLLKTAEEVIHARHGVFLDPETGQLWALVTPPPHWLLAAWNPESNIRWWHDPEGLLKQIESTDRASTFTEAVKRRIPLPALNRTNHQGIRETAIVWSTLQATPQILFDALLEVLGKER